MSHHYRNIDITLDNGEKFAISCTICNADSEGFSSFVRIEGIHHEGKHREAYKFLSAKYGKAYIEVISRMEKKVMERERNILAQ